MTNQYIEADVHEGNIQLNQLRFVHHLQGFLTGSPLLANRSLSSRPRSQSDIKRTDMNLEAMLAAVQSPSSGNQHAAVAKSFLKTNSAKRKARLSLNKPGSAEDPQGYLVPVRGNLYSTDQPASLDQYAYATSEPKQPLHTYAYAESPAGPQNDYEIPVAGKVFGMLAELPFILCSRVDCASAWEPHARRLDPSAAVPDGHDEAGYAATRSFAGDGYQSLGQHHTYAQRSPQYSSSLTQEAPDDEYIYASARPDSRAAYNDSSADYLQTITGDGDDNMRSRAVSTSHQRHAPSDAAGSAV